MCILLVSICWSYEFTLIVFLTKKMESDGASLYLNEPNFHIFIFTCMDMFTLCRVRPIKETVKSSCNLKKMRILKRFQTMLDDIFHAVLK